MKAGFVTLIGRANAGKSTLLNHLLKVPISSVSPREQTTRNRITGILTKEDFQIVFLDTPGITNAGSRLNRLLNASAKGTLQLVDLVVYLIDTKKFFIDNEILDLLKSSKKDVICLLNKIDLVDRNKLLPMIKKLSEYKFIKEFIPISALKEQNLEEFLKTVKLYLPSGEFYYPPDYISVNPEKFVIAEIIKGAIFNNTNKEIPYSTAVYVDIMEENKNIIKIYANIYVERDSQKAIIIGKNGSKMKDIGIYSRKLLEMTFQKKFFLKLFVKVKKNWQRDEKFLKMLGYTE